MKINIILIAFVLVLVMGSAQSIPTYGQMKMRGGADITFDGAGVKNMINGTSPQDGSTYSQTVQSAGMPIVGPYTHYDAAFFRYKTYGSHDELPINKAANESQGNDLVLATGNYSIDGQIKFRPGTVVVGLGNAQTRWTNSSTNRTQFNINYYDASAISLTDRCILKNIKLYDTGQRSNAAPYVRPAMVTLSWVIDSGLKAPNEVQILGVCAVNPYYFINATASHQRLVIDRCTGYPLYIGIKEDLGSDVSWITNNQFSIHYWPQAAIQGYDGYIYNWVFENGYAFWIKQSDHSHIESNFGLGYKMGFYLNGNNAAMVHNNGVDGANIAAIYVDGSSGYVSVQGNMVSGPDGASSTGIISSYGIRGIISGNRIVNASYHGIAIGGDDNVVNANNIYGFGKKGSGTPVGILLDGADRTIVTSNKIDGIGISGTTGIECWGVNDVINSNIIYNTPGFGLKFGSSGSYGTASGNVLKTTAGISDGGTGNLMASATYNQVVA
jgi:hypothetical protein